MKRTVVFIALLISAMAAVWSSVGVVWSLFLGQPDGMFWCGLTAIISGAAVAGLLGLDV